MITLFDIRKGAGSRTLPRRQCFRIRSGWCGRVAVVGLATNHQPKQGLEIDQGEPGRWVEPAA
jgi:hypothetical protein